MDNRNYAKSSLHFLVQHVFDSASDTLSPITYQELARRIGRLNKYQEGHAHGMGMVLGIMGHYLKKLGTTWGKGAIPHIQSLVVKKSGALQGLPDKGISEFWKDYPGLSKEEKKKKVETEYRKIKEFGSYWNMVLLELDLPPVQQNHSTKSPSGSSNNAGGESTAHLDLKHYILSNPQIVGASEDSYGYPEYPLPSADKVDIVFRDSNRLIAVEVKSHVSDRSVDDYDRGIFQCVKYRAVLEAMSKDERKQSHSKIDTFLVLETVLPKHLRSLAQTLEINIIENVDPKGGSQHN